LIPPLTSALQLLEMEEATLSDLEGVWVHSFGYHIKVVQGKAEFANGLTFDLKPVGKTIEMDGWRISLTKSTSEEIIWQKKGENDLKWTFEEDLHANLEAAGIDQSNIISGKRRSVRIQHTFSLILRCNKNTGEDPLTT